MANINVTLPDSMHEFVVAQAAAAGYSSHGAYVKALVRAEQKRRAKSALDKELRKGLRSPRREMTDKDWAALENSIGRPKTRSAKR
jgi:antitoxin ParD1/3/4